MAVAVRQARRRWHVAGHARHVAKLASPTRSRQRGSGTVPLRSNMRLLAQGSAAFDHRFVSPSAWTAAAASAGARLASRPGQAAVNVEQRGLQDHAHDRGRSRDRIDRAMGELALRLAASATTSATAFTGVRSLRAEPR